MRYKTYISIFFILVVLLFFGAREYIYYKEAMRLAEQAKIMQDEAYSYLSNELDEAIYSRYNNKLVHGTSIKTASDMFIKSDFRIEVKALYDTEYKIYTVDNPYVANKVNDDAYFRATLIKENGKVTGIRFNQEQ